MKKTLFLFLFFAISIPAYSQFIKEVNVGLGLATMQILGDNPNKWSMYDYHENHPSVGGSFDVMQPGFDLRATLTLNEAETMYMPVGMSYIFLLSRERIPTGVFITAKLQNDVNIFTPYIGFQYSLLRLPLASARIYAGAEARFSYIHSANYSWNLNYDLEPSLNRSKRIDSKPDAFRMGGAFRLGVMGDVFEPFKVNASVAYEAMNLIGRDNSRGELLTPLKTNEIEESLIHNLLVSLLVTYSF